MTKEERVLLVEKIAETKTNNSDIKIITMAYYYLIHWIEND